MKTKLTIVFALFMFVANAQIDKNLIPKEQEILKIKLPKFPNADFPVNTSPVSNIQLIQKVNDSINLGYALKGITGKVLVLQPAKPLTEFLQEHITRMYKAGYKKDGLKMLWVLKDIRMGGRTSVMRYNFIRVNADSYLSKDGNIFKKVCEIDTVLINERDPLFTGGQDTDIEDALRSILKKTLQAGENWFMQSIEEKAKDQIIHTAERNIALPILTDPVYKEGAYANFEEFLQNKPSISDFEPVIKENKLVKFVKSGTGQEEILKLWGICKQGEIYKYYEGRLIPIEKNGSGFIISNYVENTSRTNRNIFFSQMKGVALGAAAGAAMAYSDLNNLNKNELLVKSIPYITEPTKQPVATCIDMKTGELSF